MIRQPYKLLIIPTQHGQCKVVAGTQFICEVNEELQKGMNASIVPFTVNMEYGKVKSLSFGETTIAVKQ